MSLYISRHCDVIVMLFDIFAIVSFSVHRNRKGNSEVMLNINTVLTETRLLSYDLSLYANYIIMR